MKLKDSKCWVCKSLEWGDHDPSESNISLESEERHKISQDSRQLGRDSNRKPPYTYRIALSLYQPARELLRAFKKRNEKFPPILPCVGPSATNGPISVQLSMTHCTNFIGVCSNDSLWFISIVALLKGPNIFLVYVAKYSPQGLNISCKHAQKHVIRLCNLCT